MTLISTVSATAVTTSAASTDTISVSGTYNYSQANSVLTKLNKERTSRGLSKLTMDKTLLNAAMKRATECSVYFSHTRPSGKNCSTISSKVNGENIAAGYTSASDVMNGWMNSSGHKANILKKSYKSVGIGCFTQGGTIYWVQVFSTSSATKVSQSGKKSVTASIAIKPSLFKNALSLTADSSSIKVETTSIKVRIKNPGCGTYTTINNGKMKWSSSSSSVAKVSSSGKVTGKKAGSVKITAKTSSGKLSTSTTIKVK